MKKHAEEFTEKQRRAFAAVAFVLVALLTILATWLVGKQMLRFVSEPEKFRVWVESHGVIGWLVYMGMVCLQVVLAVIPGEPLEIVGGYAFGALEGTLLCLVAATAGSMLVFWFVRRFGVKFAEIFFPQKKLQSLRFLQSSRRRDILFFIIFSIPGTPKDLLCYFAGLTNIKPSVWLLICSLGRIPSVVTSTIGGNALGTKNYWFAIAVFAGTLAVSGIGFWIYNRICKRNKTGSPPG